MRSITMYNIETNDRLVLKAKGYNVKILRAGKVIKEVTNTLVNEIHELSKQGYYVE